MNKLINKLNSQKGQSGFTIIEVLIVLAIGALIILAVLLAVPALQRNQEANQRKAEASRVATAAVSAFSDTNAFVADGANTDLAKNAGLTDTGAKNTAVTVATETADSASAKTLTANNVLVLNKATCNGAKSTYAASGNKIAVYWSSTGGTTATGCINAQ